MELPQDLEKLSYYLNEQAYHKLFLNSLRLRKNQSSPLSIDLYLKQKGLCHYCHMFMEEGDHKEIQNLGKARSILIHAECHTFLHGSNLV